MSFYQYRRKKVYIQYMPNFQDILFLFAWNRMDIGSSSLKGYESHDKDIILKI